ncbi:hypothetical protein C8R46DRAFT_1351190 [Mycena filopes]|nr:hypothetical protein C8R46DRAFT_1351190 [Mycena filopes]
MSQPSGCWKCGAPPVSLASFLEPLPTDSSPFLADLLHTNDPPPDSEIPQLRHIIAVGETRVAALHVLQSALAKLVQRLDEASEAVAQYRAVISPVRRMPPELIAEILTWAHLASERDDPGTDVDLKWTPPPWHLAQICRAWRETALSLPSLWTCITASAALPIELIETQLERSAAAPLDICWPDVKYDGNPGLLDVLLPSSRRWRTLSLHLGRAPGPGSRNLTWLSPLEGQLDSLVTLEVVDAATLLVPAIFGAALNLRRVLLTSRTLVGSSPRVEGIPWAQITHYRGAYHPTHQLTLLSGAPHLVDCALGLLAGRVPPPAAAPDDDNGILTHPALRRLRLTDPAFLALLAAPRLERLSLRGTGTPRPPAPEVVREFTARSACVLTSLDLLRCSLPVPALAALLRAQPALTSLALESAAVLLLADGGDEQQLQPLCPRLASLLCRHANAMDEDEGGGDPAPFVKMVRARRGVLTRVRFLLPAVGLVEALCEEGLGAVVLDGVLGGGELDEGEEGEEEEEG